MLIRWATNDDKTAWIELAKNVGEDMEHLMIF